MRVIAVLQNGIEFACCSGEQLLRRFRRERRTTMKLKSILIEADDGTTYSLPLSEWTTENGVHGF